MLYTVESSNDLSNWTTQDELYGLGNEYVVTMREYLPPPPGTPPIIRPAPATNVSLRVQPASGAAGGSAVSWPSLDHGGPVVVRIAGEMDAAWNRIPIFSNRFAAYNFFFWHPGVAAAPPAQNPPLGPKDTAMLAVLEASVSEINLQIAASILQSRNAPLPAPPDPNSKHFWRVKVDADIDTDQDGSPDWAEYEIATHGTGMLVSGVVGDAFDADTNGDGIPDGDQLDADLDGTADAKDPDVADNTATYPIGPLPRYALFPITNAEPSPAYKAPFQINDKGTVLYDVGTWSGGVWTPLKPPANGDPWITARAINDNDVILGAANLKVREDPELSATIICSWSVPDAVPSFVSTGTGDSVKYAAWSYVFAANRLSPGSVLSNDGHFSMPTWGLEDDQFQQQSVGFWKLPVGQQPASVEDGDGRLYFTHSTDLKWGDAPQLTSDGHVDWTLPVKGVVYAPGLLPFLPFSPTNVIANPGHPVIALPDIEDNQKGMTFIDGAWKGTDAYAEAIDMSADGIAIGRNHAGLTAPIHMNGNWTDIERTTPGLSFDSTVTVLDTTPSGWVLAQRGDLNIDREYSVMVPLRAEGQFTDQYGAIITKAAGVDDMSIGSTDPGPAVQDRIWIMAPKGGPSKIVSIKAPVNENTPIKVTAAGVDFGESDGSATLSDLETFLNIAAGSATTGTDIPVKLSFGTLDSLSKPIGVKVMKERTVNVTTHFVTSKIKDADPTKPDRLDTPAFQPIESAIEKYLNDVYGPQVNAKFDVKINIPEPLEWDKSTTSDLGITDPRFQNVVTSANKRLDFLGDEESFEEELIDGELHDNTADINVYILGGGTLAAYLVLPDKMQIGGLAYGVSRRAKNIAFVDGDAHLFGAMFPERNTDAELMHTIAHEIGHCIMADGHPDQGSGAAHLPGLPLSSHKERLMISGANVNHKKHGNLLVKGEWNEAERWFKGRLNGDN